MSHRRVVAGGALLQILVLCTGAAREVVGQSAVPDIRSSARVKSIGFQFTGSASFSATELGGVLALKGRSSLYGIRRALGELPLIQSPGSQRFDPVELQKDVVRLTRFYQRSGFLRPAVDYELKTNADGTLVDVIFRIEEGPAVTLRDLWIATRAGDAAANLPSSLLPAWSRLETELSRARGHRFGDAEAALLEELTKAWLQDHGYPLPRIQLSRQLDSNQVDVTLRVQPGRRRRVGNIDVKGNRSVADGVVLRELPFETGDWYSAAGLAAARMRLQQIDLFRQATMELQPGTDADTSVGVQVQVMEAGPRLSLAEIGYISEGAGISGRVQWNHPNFTGGARSLTTSLEAQTGAGAVTGPPEKLLRGSVSLTQPYVYVSQLSLIVGPFAEYRDDLQDQSIDVGLSTILLYRLGGLSSVALEYRYSASHIYEYRFGNSSSGTINLGELLSLQAPSLIDSLGRDIDRSSLALSGSFSKLDDLANPRRGWSIRPRAELTMPAALSTVQFGRLDVSLSGFHPLSRKVGLAGRISAGRLFPFGKSIPGPQDNPAYSLIRLRDETMTAGGTDDVRGWSSRLLGPKFPAIEANVQGADTVLSADGYAPIGALARLAGTLELRFPCPWMSSSWGTELFLDAGRVWTPDERFALPVLEGETDVRFSAGAGLSYRTPVGAVRLSLGYKLNPSVLDLRDADDVLNALLQGLPATTAETEWTRRLHLHLSFGMTL